MDNLLESIKELIENEELKLNLIKEFNSQINWLSDLNDKWLNYKSFLSNKDILDIFVNEFDINFIEKQIIWFISTSNISHYDIPNNLPEITDDLFLKACLRWLNEEERDTWKELINTWWNYIKQVFYDNTYNASSNIYIWVKDSLTLLKIIFYIILSEIKKEEDYNKITNIKSVFNNLFNNWIYQFILFYREEKQFWPQMLLVSILGIFLEDSDRRFDLKSINLANISVATTEIFNISILEISELEKILLSLKKFQLTFNLLRKIETNKIVNDNYKREILLSLLNYKIFEDSDLVNFSILFSQFEDVKIKYFEIIEKIDFKKEEILNNLNNEDNNLQKDTIHFLLLEKSKNYLSKSIKNQLIKIIKTKLLEKLTLPWIYWDLYKKTVDGYLWDINLWFTFDNLWEKLTEESVNDLSSFKFTIENIDKIIIQKDLDKFYFKLIRNHIAKQYSECDTFSIKDIRATFWFDDKNKYIKDSLQKINNEWDLIKRWIWNWNYKVKWKLC